MQGGTSDAHHSDGASLWPDAQHDARWRRHSVAAPGSSGIHRRAGKADRSQPTASSFDDYAAAFAPELAVTLNGKLISSTKAAWIAAERHRLGKVDRFVVAFAEGYDALLVIERYDDRSDLPSSPAMLFDPRYKARALRYGVGPDHLVHTIRIVETDGVFEVPK